MSSLLEQSGPSLVSVKGVNTEQIIQFLPLDPLPQLPPAQSRRNPNRDGVEIFLSCECQQIMII